jgi:hypothetical protein
MLAGVALGNGLWFFGVSWAVSLRHGKFSAGTLLKMERMSGVVLLVLAMAHATTIVWQMARHKM